MVLMPSFFGEVCVTLVEKNGDVSLAVRCLDLQFWAHGAPGTLVPFHGGECDFGYGLFQGVLDGFAEARMQAELDRTLCLDGMGLDVCLVTDGIAQTFEINAGAGGASASLARRLIEWSWTLIEDPIVRNAVARCGKFVGREYAIKPEPTPKPVTRLAVLGAADDRAEYLQKLRMALSRQDPARR
jgi:hypothetical protein